MTKLEQAAREVVRQHSMECLSDKAVDELREALSEQALQKLSDFHQSIEEPKCNQHPDAPHGFDRNASHNAGRYVCECEGWSTADMAYRPGGLSMDKEQEPFDMNDHPPHRLCECRKCMEYFTPLPDCDAFAAHDKPIAEQEPIGYIDAADLRELCNGNERQYSLFVEDKGRMVAIYAAPIRTKDLTDDEIWSKGSQVRLTGGGIKKGLIDFARAVIAADREKNK